MKEILAWKDVKRAFEKVANERRYLGLRAALFVTAIYSAYEMWQMCQARPLSDSLNRPVPMVTPVNNSSTEQADIIEAILSKSTAVDGLVKGPRIKIGECPNEADGWQVREQKFHPGYGLYQSSGGLTDREVYNQLFYNPSRISLPAKGQKGQAFLECTKGHNVISQKDVKYSIRPKE